LYKPKFYSVTIPDPSGTSANFVRWFSPDIRRLHALFPNLVSLYRSSKVSFSSIGPIAIVNTVAKSRLTGAGYSGRSVDALILSSLLIIKPLRWYVNRVLTGDSPINVGAGVQGPHQARPRNQPHGASCITVLYRVQRLESIGQSLASHPGQATTQARGTYHENIHCGAS
jgi:hypothetical protein